MAVREQTPDYRQREPTLVDANNYLMIENQKGGREDSWKDLTMLSLYVWYSFSVLPSNFANNWNKFTCEGGIELEQNYRNV